MLASTLLVAEAAEAEEFTSRSRVLPQGAIELTGEQARPRMVGMVFNDGLQRVYMAPHLYFGVNDTVTLGVSHVYGLCIDCDRVYDDVGFTGLVALTNSPDLEIDLHFRVPISSFDPFMLGTNFGVLGRVRAGDILGIVFDPYVYVGFTERDGFSYALHDFGGPMFPNREHLVLPIWFYFQATERIAPFVGTGLAGPFDNFGDFYRIPVEGGVVFEVTNDIDLGPMMRFYNLAGRRGDAEPWEIGMLGRFRF